MLVNYVILILSECIEQMVSDMLNSSEISPSLSAIVDHFDTDDRRQSWSFCSEQDNDVSADTLGDYGAWDNDHDDQASVIDEATHDQDTMFPSQHEDPYLVNISLLLPPT